MIPHVPIDGETIESPTQHFPGRLRPAWYPSCASCLASWRALYKVADYVPASVPVEHAIVVREQHGAVYELALRVRCHGKRDRLGVTHVRDESELARYTFFPTKGSK